MGQRQGVQRRLRLFGRADVPAFDLSVDSKLVDLTVIRSFEHMYAEAETEKRVTSFGVMFASRRVFMNVKTAAVGQGDSVFGASDETYKFHFGGWRLINFGTYSTQFTCRKFSKHFVPCYVCTDRA